MPDNGSVVGDGVGAVRPKCPVCGRRGQGESICRVCGWALWLGEPGGGELSSSGELEAARRAFDAIAAARVSPGEDGRQLPCIRGGTPDEAEWERAVLAASPANASETMLAQLLRQPLAGLNGTDRLTVIELTAEGVGDTQVRVGRLGTPEILPARQLATWADLLPMLSTDPAVCSFQVAGGIASFDHEQLWAELRRGLDRVVDAPPGQPVVITSAAAGWTVPEWAMDALAERYAPASTLRVSGVPLGPLLGRLAEGSALHQSYELVVAAVHPTTYEVMLQSRQLFPVGASPGTQADLSLRCVASDEHGTVLAVVTWHDGDPEIVSIGSVKLRPGTYRLHAVLDGPARVRFIEPAGVAPEERPWSELLSLIPERLEPSVPAVDLICGVELGGSRDVVDARLRVIHELIKVLGEECPDPSRLQVAILGYRDHPLDERMNSGRVVRGAWLTPAADALATLARFRPAELVYQDAAPVEDMLVTVLGRHKTLTPGRRTVLLTVGGRPPHPPKVNEKGVLPCPDNHDWARLLRSLERNTDLSCIAVVDRLDVRNHPAWRRLGSTALYELPETEARRLGMDIGVLMPHVRRLPFPLLDEE